MQDENEFVYKRVCNLWFIFLFVIYFPFFDIVLGLKLPTETIFRIIAFLLFLILVGWVQMVQKIKVFERKERLNRWSKRRKH